MLSFASAAANDRASAPLPSSGLGKATVGNSGSGWNNLQRAKPRVRLCLLLDWGGPLWGTPDRAATIYNGQNQGLDELFRGNEGLDSYFEKTNG